MAVLKLAVCRDAVRRADLTATAELLFIIPSILLALLVKLLQAYIQWVITQTRE